MRQARFTVTLSQASTDTVTVDWETVAGTATSPSDFTADSGTLTFAPGELTKDVIVLIRDQLAGSSDEQFTV